MVCHRSPSTRPLEETLVSCMIRVLAQVGSGTRLWSLVGSDGEPTAHGCSSSENLTRDLVAVSAKERNNSKGLLIGLVGDAHESLRLIQSLKVLTNLEELNLDLVTETRRPGVNPTHSLLTIRQQDLQSPTLWEPKIATNQALHEPLS